MKTLHWLLPIATVFILPMTGLAAPGDADMADSLNFEEFHKDKPGAITIWDSDKGQFVGLKEKKTEVTYDPASPKAAAKPGPAQAPQPQATRVGQGIASDEDKAAVATPGPSALHAQTLEAQRHQEKLSHGEGFDGQRFMIRVRYSPSAENNGTTASAATNSLHGQMAQHCPTGWMVIREWSLPVEQDYYLHTLFQCASE